MDLPSQGTPNQPRRRAPWKLIAAAVLLLAIAVALYLILSRQPSQPPVTPTPGPAATGTSEGALRAAQNVERERNLAAVHDLIAAYRDQLGSYPEKLEDLLKYQVRGKTPTFATRVVEAKLDDGSPAYTIQRRGESYELCAQKVGEQPTCEAAP